MGLKEAAQEEVPHLPWAIFLLFSLSPRFTPTSSFGFCPQGSRFDLFRYVQLCSHMFVRIAVRYAVRLHRDARWLYRPERVRHHDDFRVYGSKNPTTVLYAMGSPPVKFQGAFFDEGYQFSLFKDTGSEYT